MKQPKKGRCNAKVPEKAGGGFCGRWPEPGKERCARHGGKSRSGIEAPNFKHGMRSAYLKADVKARHDAALGDPQLQKLETDLATVEMLITYRVEAMKGKTPTKAQEAALLNLIEHRRRILETMTRQQERLKLMVPVGQVKALGIAMAQAVLDCVPDEVQRRNVQQRFIMLMRGTMTPAEVMTGHAGQLAIQQTGEGA